ncbi:ATP-binding protein [Lutibacter sp.]|uniref:PAS domain-containing sensor histidine kinase n=1 Tax=Lutibacter sp. TaxID=1925666 RepID=UPI0034A07CB1
MLLKENKAFFKVCFDSMQVGIIAFNLKKEIVLANTPIMEIFNYTSEEIYNNNINVLLKSNGLINEFIKGKNTEKFKSLLETYGVKKGGFEIPIEVSFGKMEFEGQFYYKALISDITVRKEKELKKDILNYQLEEEVKLRTIELEKVIKKLKESLNKEKDLNNLKTQFITLASHEFKTPLSAIITSAELIIKYADLNRIDKRDEHFLKVKSKIIFLNNMIDNLLTLENIESGNITPSYTSFKFSDLVKDIINNTSPFLKKKQQIIFSNNIGDYIHQDSKIIKIILKNLLFNAIKYSNKDILIKLSADAENIYFTIEDKGIGIPKTAQKFIFQRFFRAKNAVYYPGTGIGLNIAKGYLEKLNGSISFESTENKGTIFYLTLPKLTVEKQ